MKIIKQLSVLFLVINLFNACTKKETSYALQQISAPTSVSAEFNIAQDESGEVSVTPSAVGASSFEVYFGDVENEEPTLVALGETAVHVYAEGEFTLRIVAIGLTGLKSELSRIVTISFDAPTDLELNITASETNPFEIAVAPTATNATVFDIYFGDVENEEPTTIMAGESATYVYDEIGDYTVRVVARGAGSSTTELSEVVTISGATEPVELPITFEDATVNYVINGFGASDFGPIPAQIIDNPDASGINTSAKVLEIDKLADAQTFAGAAIPLAGAIDWSGGTTIAIKVWSPRVGTPIRFKIEDSSSPPDGNGNPTVFAEVEVNSTVASGWEELLFDMTAPVAGAFDTSISYDSSIIFPDFGSTGQGESFYFDDVAIAGTGGVGAAPEIPIDFESTTINYVINGFGASDFGPIPAQIIDNPDASGINTSAKVLEIDKLAGAQTFAGASIPLAGAIDWSGGTTIAIKVWSPRVGTPIRFKIEDSSSPPDGNGNPTVFAEVEVNSTVSSGWEELLFDMTTPVAGAFDTSISFDTSIIFPDFGSSGLGESFYFDDVIIAGTGGVGAAPEIPINFESTTINYVINGFGASDFGPIPAQIIDNPDASGINTSAKVLEIDKLAGAQTFAGASIPLAGAIDWSGGTTIAIKVWSPRVGTPIRFKIEDSSSPPDGNGNPTVFAEVEVNSTVASGWEELLFDMTTPVAGAFNTGISFDTAIIFPDFGSGGLGESFYFDDVIIAGTGGVGAAPEIPINFESTTINYVINGFGASDFGPIPAQIIDNPDASGINTSAKVLEIDKLAGAQTFAGASIPLAGAIDWTGGTTIAIKVWSPRVGTPIRFKIEDSSSPPDGNGNPTVFAEVEVNSTVASGWEELLFDMTAPVAGAFNTSISFDTAIIFPDFGSGGLGESFYFDDITQQ